MPELTNTEFAAHLRVAAKMMDCEDNHGNPIVPGIVRSMKKAADIIDTDEATIAALQAENAEKDKEIERLKDIVEAYAESARSVALWLDAYCNRSLPYDKMISDAARKAAVTLSRVEAERDAAMKEIPHECRTCKHKPQKYGVCGMGCEVDPLTIRHAEHCNWEWRGAQGEA